MGNRVTKLRFGMAQAITILILSIYSPVLLAMLLVALSGGLK
jgi:hypothetical protein